MRYRGERALIGVTQVTLGQANGHTPYIRHTSTKVACEKSVATHGNYLTSSNNNFYEKARSWRALSNPHTAGEDRGEVGGSSRGLKRRAPPTG